MTDDIKAIRDALAAGPDTGGGHIYTHPRDSNQHAANFEWHQACHPERIARLLDALEAATRDAERYRWLRDEGNPYALLVVGRYHEKDVRPFYDAELDAAIDAAMKRGA